MREKTGRRRRFTIKTLLAFTLFVAILLGWRATFRELQRVRDQAYRQAQRTRLIEDHIDSIYESKASNQRPGRWLLSGANLDGCDFRNVTITTNDPAFSSATFVGAKLQNATISVGGSSFQHVNFDQADLRGAKLAAGASLFQLATFFDADLSGATIIANGAALQASSFRDANLTGAVLKLANDISNFQAVDVNAANFSDADLSGVNADNLDAAYYSVPPTYTAGTKFPDGFDPKVAGWLLASDDE